ncbi:MAG: DUF1801 domain-containing protein [Pseudomonadota bacterium]
MAEFSTPEVEAAFAAFPSMSRPGLLRLRELVFDTAAGLPAANPLEEALRWGQPAYLAPKGSTVRLGVPKTANFGLFVHCQSRLIPDFTSAFPREDQIEGTRAVLFDDADQIDETRHGWLIARALTYHL